MFASCFFSAPVLVLVAATMGPTLASAQPANENRSEATRQGGPGFADITESSGVSGALARHCERHPKWWLSGLNLVDLDGDGKLDLFLAAHGAGRSLVLLNDGHGHFKEAEGTYPASEIHLAADVNEDGKVDLQMTWQDGGGKWWRNESSPGQLRFTETAITAGQARANALIDLNRDGKVDWLHERPGVSFELGDGRGNFSSSGHLDIAATRNEINVHPADLNGDGFIDLAVHWGRYDYERGRSRIYINDRKMNFTNATEVAGLHEDGLAIKGIADLNQDGHLDLMVLEAGQPGIYLNDGTGRFSPKTNCLSGMQRARKPRYVSWGLAVAADFDNDGRADILWNGRNFLWLLRGEGDGKYVYMNTAWRIEDNAAAAVDDGLCFGDIDGDGALDIVGYTGSTDAHRMITVYHNELPRRNWLRVRLRGAAGNACAAGARIKLLEQHPKNPSEALFAFEQVSILDSQSAHSYYALAPTERHFGLGGRTEIQVQVEFYPSGKIVARTAKANSIVEIAEGP